MSDSDESEPEPASGAGAGPDDAPGPTVRVCEDRGETEAAYAAAEAAGTVYLAVEASDDGWGVVYDLLPAGGELPPGVADRLRETVTERVETHVREAAGSPEVGHSVGPEMGTCYGLASRAAAETLAAEIQGVLAEAGFGTEG